MVDEPRTRLDQLMDERRLEVRKRWIQIAREASISTSALSQIRRGEYRPSPLTARLLEEALRWEPRSIDAILAGGDPTPTESGERPPERPPGEPMTMEEIINDPEALERLGAFIDRVRELQQQARGDVPQTGRDLRRDEPGDKAAG